MLRTKKPVVNQLSCFCSRWRFLQGQCQHQKFETSLTDNSTATSGQKTFQKSHHPTTTCRINQNFIPPTIKSSCLKKIEISGSRSVCRFPSAEIVKNASADRLNITFLLFSLSTTPGIRQNSLKIFCHILVKPLSTFRHSDTARSFQDLSFNEFN